MSHLNKHQRTKHSNHRARSNALLVAHTKFIIDASVPASQCETMTGVPASITIAQAILESGWGNHHIGTANNYFGIKAQDNHGVINVGDLASGYVSVLTKEHIKKSNTDITIRDNFRSYAGMQESFEDHGLFLKNNPRYKKALDDYAKTGDADAFAKGLQDAGYATDPHYALLLISIMRRHKLYRFNSPKNPVGRYP